MLFGVRTPDGIDALLNVDKAFQGSIDICFAIFKVLSD
jgi:hypothetical protein